MLWIGQAYVGDVVFLPIVLKGVRAVGPYGQDFCLTEGEFGIVISQAR